VTSNGPIAGSRADFLARMAGNEVIFFGFDKFDIDQEDAASLQAQAQWLMQYSNKRATIEGHADERGTREYNLALGERRANAAKNYLVSLGVSANRLNVVSYGKERPAASGSNEQAWAQNRRAVTVAVD
jgi:peptidoglycan-associated lipoprotein